MTKFSENLCVRLRRLSLLEGLNEVVALRLKVKILAFLRLTANFFPLWLTEMLIIIFHFLKSYKLISIV